MTDRLSGMSINDLSPPLATPSTSFSSSHHSRSTGAIVGGIAGGISGALLLAGLVWFVKRRQHRTRPREQERFEKAELEDKPIYLKEQDQHHHQHQIWDSDDENQREELQANSAARHELPAKAT
jgi:hypothetical protein